MTILDIEIFRNAKGTFLRLKSTFNFSTVLGSGAPYMLGGVSAKPMRGFGAGFPLVHALPLGLRAGASAESRLFVDPAMNTINLSFLGAADLSDATFKLDSEQLISSDKFKAFAQGLASAAKEIYKSHLKPPNVRMVVTVAEVETV